MQTNVISAVFRRQLSAYFASPTGYVFITIFVFLSSFAAFWTPMFFARNLANLDQLMAWFPSLLLFLAPAIAMGSWSEERKEGTDELLLTLPAGDWSLALGKYLACLAIFTVAMAFAGAGQVVVLSYLGRPDPGLLVGAYLGQWLAGAALLPVAMVGSAMTRNLTVSFILGAVLCALFVGAGALARWTDGSVFGAVADALAMPGKFDDFARGVVTPESVAYFLAVAATALWTNVFLIGRWRTAGAPGSGVAASLALVRGVSVAVAGLALATLLGRTPVRADVTAEGLWTLSKETRRIVKQTPKDRTVFITAYVSKDVPAQMAQARENLLGALREIERSSRGSGSSAIEVRVVEVEPFSDAAREAQKTWKITPRTVGPGPDDPAGAPTEVFLGVALACGAEQRVIPFMSRGLSPEYELARAVRAVSATARKKVGVLDTEAGLFGRFNFQTFTPTRDWPAIEELRKQYDVVKVAKNQPAPADIDALIIPQPSSLSDAELKHTLDYIRSGRPALILEDPLPMMNPGLSTTEPREATRNPFMQNQPPQEPKANLFPLWNLLGIEPIGLRVAWDAHNPRPALADMPREYLFLGRSIDGRADRAASGEASALAGAFNDKDLATSGLQEVVVITGGMIRAAKGATTTLTPLLTASPVSGYVDYREVLSRSFFGGGGFNPQRKFVRSDDRPVLAARITGAPPAAPAKEGEAAPPPPAPLNVIFIADLDLISEMFFGMREEGFRDLEFDNVTFAMNAVDTLTGDDALVALRKRRPQHRTLERLEERRMGEQRATQQAVDEAGRQAEEELARVRERMNARVKEIEGRADLDEQTKRIMVESVRQSEQRRLDVQAASIEDQKQQRVAEAKARASREVRDIELGIRAAAVALPPLPALFLAGAVFMRRRAMEREGVSEDRLA